MKSKETCLGGMLVILLVFGMMVVGCEDAQPTHIHIWGEWIVTKQATETEFGEETRTCSTCGEETTRSISRLPSSLKGTVFVTASYYLQYMSLKADVGELNGTSAALYSYQWMRGGVDIGGARSSSYDAIERDYGAVISVRVTYYHDTIKTVDKDI